MKTITINENDAHKYVKPAQVARTTLAAYAAITGSDLLLMDSEATMANLLADLMHFAAREDLDFAYALGLAQEHFNSERSPEPIAEVAGETCPDKNCCGPYRD